MKSSHSVLRAGIFCCALLAIAPSASADFAGQALPDMAGLRNVFGDVASGKTEVEPVRDGDGLLGSGIEVPDTGAFGNMAKAIAGPMGEQIGDASVSATFEKAFADGIVGVENALPQLGFKKRDYGVGFALFFIMAQQARRCLFGHLEEHYRNKLPV